MTLPDTPDMNPYGFVRPDWGRPPRRAPYTRRDRFSGSAGYLDCRLTVDRPLFIPQPHPAGAANGERSDEANDPVLFIHNIKGQKIVPGSTLKGLLRGLVETLGPGCWRLYNGGTYTESQRDKTIETPFSLPSPYQPCHDVDDLCPACRLFGMIEPPQEGRDSRAFAGKVTIDDAICTTPIAAKPPSLYVTPLLVTPKPHHTAWYRDKQDRPIGRKYYFHQQTVQARAAPFPPERSQLTHAHITPLDTGSAFSFRVRFTDLETTLDLADDDPMGDDFALLVYALVLDADDHHHVGLRHKLGYAKPAGFGSVRITIASAQLQRMEDRYRTGRAAPLPEADLADLLRRARERAVRIAPSSTLRELRHIWRWPPADTPRNRYRYPGWRWFDGHGQTPLPLIP